MESVKSEKRKGASNVAAAAAAAPITTVKPAWHRSHHGALLDPGQRGTSTVACLAVALTCASTAGHSDFCACVRVVSACCVVRVLKSVGESLGVWS